jgi:outer membrane protein assembly factor BamB
MAVERFGAVRWSLANIDEITRSTALAPDGTIYVANDGDSTLYAFDPTGQKRWQFKPGDRFTSSPAIARDGTVLIGAENWRLYAVRPDGTQRWTFQTGRPDAAPPGRGIAIRSSPAIALDGTIYFGAPDQYLYALNPDGSLKWRSPVQLGFDALWSPAIGGDGTVYIGGEGLHAVDRSGRLRWTYLGTNPRSGTDGFASPIVAANGSIYVAGGISQRHVFAMGPDGTLKWDYPTEGLISMSPAIGFDGTILAASGGTLYALVELEGSNGGYVNAPWPKERGDLANTGRARR